MAHDPRWDNEIPDKDKDMEMNDEGPTSDDEGPTSGDEGPTSDDEGPTSDDEGPTSGDEGPPVVVDDKTVYQDIDEGMFWQLVDLIGEYPRSILVNHPLFHIMNEYFEPNDHVKTVSFFQMPTGTTVEVTSVTELFESVFDFCHAVLPNSEFCRRIDLAMTMMKSWCEADETSSQLMSRLTM